CGSGRRAPPAAAGSGSPSRAGWPASWAATSRWRAGTAAAAPSRCGCRWA
ncbi:MAG: hypothetical protein AVDCRST_MAG40-3192, partial [uncultured Gemmatimonadaceae bacterium]